jgi:hypothetical protein
MMPIQSLRLSEDMLTSKQELEHLAIKGAALLAYREQTAADLLSVINSKG